MCTKMDIVVPMIKRGLLLSYLYTGFSQDLRTKMHSIAVPRLMVQQTNLSWDEKVLKVNFKE